MYASKIRFALTALALAAFLFTNPAAGSVASAAPVSTAQSFSAHPLGQQAGAIGLSAGPRASSMRGVKPDTKDVPGEVWACPPCECYYDAATGQSGVSYCCPNSWGTPCDLTVWWEVSSIAARASFTGTVDWTKITSDVPLSTLSGLGDTTGLAVDESGDVIAAGYGCVASECGNNALTFFAAGSTVPTATYLDPWMGTANFVASEKAGTVFVSGQNAETGGIEVDEITGIGGSSPVVTRLISKSGALDIAGGVAVDKKGRLWFENSAGATVTEYAPPSYSKAIAQFTTDGCGVGGTTIALDPSGKYLLAACNAGSSSAFDTWTVTYGLPQGNALLESGITQSSTPIFGVSFAPKKV